MNSTLKYGTSAADDAAILSYYCDSLESLTPSPYYYEEGEVLNHLGLNRQRRKYFNQSFSAIFLCGQFESTPIYALCCKCWSLRESCQDHLTVSKAGRVNNKLWQTHEWSTTCVVLDASMNSAIR